MNVRPAGREACRCASPYNSILERLTAMEAEILTAMQEANTAVGIANAALRQVQAAGIRTVNQIQPDADGDFSITAGTGIQINAGTNGIEIENISEGAVYTGVSPISVNADNEISLDDWVEVTGNQWAAFKDSNNAITEDLILITKTDDGIQDDIYIPKGTPINRLTFNPINARALYFMVPDTSTYYFYKYIFSNTESLSGSAILYQLPTQTKGVNTINERIEITYQSYSYTLYKTGTFKNVFLYKRG